MKNSQKFSLLIFPCCVVILTLLIWADNYSLLAEHKSVFFTYSHNFTNGQVGYGRQPSAPEPNNLPLDQLEPGDILLGGWPGCAYGHFSHAGLYLGDNRVLESYVDTGVTVNSVSHYSDYTYACILRVKADQKVKQRAIDYALKQQGKLFYPVSFKNDERYWNCSKIIWKAYQREGINIDAANDIWIPPDNFYQSDQVMIVALKGGVPH